MLDNLEQISFFSFWGEGVGVKIANQNLAHFSRHFGQFGTLFIFSSCCQFSLPHTMGWWGVGLHKKSFDPFQIKLTNVLYGYLA